MASRSENSQPRRPRRPPATTIEGRQNQLVGMAVDLAERQLADGTAPAQVVTHYLKLGTVREKLENQKLESENALLLAKIDALESAQTSEALYKDALNAMRRYSGHPEEVIED